MRVARIALRLVWQRVARPVRGAGAMSRIEIFRGETRRRWSDEAKRQLVAETLVPGASVHAVAQRHGVNTSQLFSWRKRFRAALDGTAVDPPVPAFTAVELAPAHDPIDDRRQPVPEPDPAASRGVIEIELPQRGRVRIAGIVDPAMVTAALRALVRR